MGPSITHQLHDRGADRIGPGRRAQRERAARGAIAGPGFADQGRGATGAASTAPRSGRTRSRPVQALATHGSNSSIRQVGPPGRPCRGVTQREGPRRVDAADEHQRSASVARRHVHRHLAIADLVLAHHRAVLLCRVPETLQASARHDNCPACREPSPMDVATRQLVSRRAAAPLAGRIGVPGDKSISHRALMFGALAVGETRITGLLEGEDVLRTAAAMRALGAEVTHDADGTWRVAGRGVGGLTEPADVLDMGNSGTAARLLCGILASHPIFAVMTGDASLRRRPMRRVIDPLSACGARFAVARGRPAAARRAGAERGAAARVPRAGAVGAGEVGGAAVRAERARHHPRRGARGDARPHREHAAPLRRRRCRSRRRAGGASSRCRASRSCARPMWRCRAIRRRRRSWWPRRCWCRVRG